MIRLLLAALCLLSTGAFAQTRLDSLLEAEYQAGHFNGAVLVVRNGKVAAQVNKGYANFPFAVPITNDTRFPIASMTKTFTALLVLQLHEHGLLRLDDKAAAYLPELPAACQTITIRDLLTHHSGLKNEPLAAYQAKYSSAEYSKKFVVAHEHRKAPAFHYNNVDYVLLTRIVEAAARKSYAQLLQDHIFGPLGMAHSGLVRESAITPLLANGYHNYSFGAGKKNDTLFADSPGYLSNYAGAGALYATPHDLAKLVAALHSHRLLSAKATAAFLIKPQTPTYIEGIRGYPTLGFYYNDKTFARPILERRGSINGFNSVLLTDTQFTKAVIILTNTDTADLEVLADKVYATLR